MARQLVFLLVLSTVLGQSQSGSQKSLYDYRGTLNGAVIGLALIHGPDRELHGSYFYKRYLKDIPLKGEYTSDRDIDLREYDGSGSVRAVFHLRFVETDPTFENRHLHEEILSGTWNSGSKTFPVHLSLSDEVFVDDENHRYESMGVMDKEGFEHEVGKFYFAVLKNDKREASSRISYPLWVFVGKRKLVLHSPSEFLRWWNEIFSPEYISCLKEGVPHNMFTNYHGAMLGNGEIWFDEKGRVTALNSCLSRKGSVE